MVSITPLLYQTDLQYFGENNNNCHLIYLHNQNIAIQEFK